LRPKWAQSAASIALKWPRMCIFMLGHHENFRSLFPAPPCPHGSKRSLGSTFLENTLMRPSSMQSMSHRPPAVCAVSLDRRKKRIWRETTPTARSHDPDGLMDRDWSGSISYYMPRVLRPVKSQDLRFRSFWDRKSRFWGLLTWSTGIGFSQNFSYQMLGSNI